MNTAGKGWLQRMRIAAGGRLLNRVEGLALARADAIHVLSQYSAQLIRKIHGRTVSLKVSEIPWFVESDTEQLVERTSARLRLGWAADRFHVITLRRLVPRMGVDTLVLANALLPEDSNILVHVIGDGPQRASLERLALSGRRSGALTFHGRLSDDDVDQAYAAADAFVLPTTALEGFGLIILEALARGVPVIGSDVGAIPEVLGRIDPDAIVRAGDATALAGKILTLANTGVTSQRRAALAKKVREEFPKNRTLDRYEAFLTGSASVSAGPIS